MSYELLHVYSLPCSHFWLMQVCITVANVISDLQLDTVLLLGTVLIFYGLQSFVFCIKLESMNWQKMTQDWNKILQSCSLSVEGNFDLFSRRTCLCRCLLRQMIDGSISGQVPYVFHYSCILGNACHGISSWLVFCFPLHHKVKLLNQFSHMWMSFGFMGLNRSDINFLFLNVSIVMKDRWIFG